MPNIPIISGIFKWIMEENMDYGLFLAIFGLIAAIFGLHWMGITEGRVFSWIFYLAPIWLPITAFGIFFWKYMDMVGKLFYLDTGRRTYEIIMPQEVYKSPEAMESVLTQIFNKATPDNLMETYLQGKRPQVFSLEIVSRKGEVKFYANVPVKKGARMFEPAMYSQYPGIELRELEVDYTAEIPHDLKDHLVMSFHHSKKDPQAYPIKTYKDLKLDELPKEEEKVDPLVQLLDFMSVARSHEQLWLQILCTAHREQSFKNGQLRKKDTWEGEIEEEINKLMQRDPKTKAGPVEFEGMPRITSGERDLVEAMERNVEKPAFSVALRWMYIVDFREGKPNGDYFAGMLRGLSSFDVGGRNKIGPKWRTDFNYKFISDPFGKRLDALRKQELKEYKLRKLFPKFPGMSPKVMSTEEIATMWHPVGTVAYTPTLQRVESAKQQAPSNLPISQE